MLRNVEALSGIVVAMATSLVVWYTGAFTELIGKSYSLFHAVLLPKVIATAGVVGDLSESLIKRSVGVEDSSSTFPGIGGVLDVLDSLLFAAPIMYVYILVFLK